MRKLIATAVLILLSCAAVAQEMGPPKIIQIGREEVKIGKGAAHDKYEAQWAKAMAKANPRPSLGMTSMTNNEEWWVTGYESFADWEKDANNSATGAVMAQFIPGDAEYISNTRTVVARFRGDLSYGVGAPLGAAHGFSVRTVRVRPGHNGEYEEIRKMVKQAVESGNVKNVRSAAYQVVAGAPSGTFLLFTAFTSLAERDTPNEAMTVAMRDVGPKIADLQSKSILSSEDQIFVFNPKLSNPPKDMVAAAPDFWHPKETMAKATPSKPGADKSKPKAGQ
jgi:hypothetical protein